MTGAAESSAAPPAGVVRTEPFELTATDGLPIRGTALLPARATGAVLLCHGFKGFSRWGFFPYLAEQLAAAGLTAIRFDFSGSGIGPDGEQFTESEAFFRNSYRRELEEIALVERAAVERGWIGAGYGLFGHSRGGGMAILYAARATRHDAHGARVGALVTWSAISTVMRWPAADAARWRERGYTEVTNARTGQVFRISTDTLDQAEREGGGGGALDIESAARRMAVPWLIVHGAADESVPAAEGERLAAAAPRERTTFLRLGGADHAFGIRHPMPEPSAALAEATRRTMSFFQQHLAAAAPAR